MLSVVVSVPAKLLSLLDAFTEGNAAWTLSELSRRTGLPLTTTHRLAGELQRWGGLERGEDGRYRIGLRLVELAALCPRGTGLRDVALPFMQDLYEATHQNVQLAVRDGLDGVYIERISGRLAVPVRTKIGAHWPLHATGVGLVLLAYAPPAVQEEVLAGPLKRFTPHTFTDPASCAGSWRRCAAPAFRCRTGRSTSTTIPSARRSPGRTEAAWLPCRSSSAMTTRAAPPGARRCGPPRSAFPGPSKIQDQAGGLGRGDADHHEVAGRPLGRGEHGVPVVRDPAKDWSLAGAAGTLRARGQHVDPGVAQGAEHRLAVARR